MNFTCPACNAVFPAEAALVDNQAREAVRAALLLPSALADRTLRYLGLFRPARRALSWERAARLLTELTEAVNAGRVERNGRAWVAPMPLWQQALDDLLAKRDKLQLPLKSHGYLFEMVAGLAAKSEGASEQRDIERAAHPGHRVLNTPDQAPAADPEVRRAALDLATKITRGGKA